MTRSEPRRGTRRRRSSSAHLLFLRDDALLAPTRRAIQADHRTAAQAWQGAIDTMAGAWEAIEDPYLRARADDLRSVGAQVLARILGIEPPAPRSGGTGHPAGRRPHPRRYLRPRPRRGHGHRHRPRRPHQPRGGPGPIDGDPRRRGSGRPPHGDRGGTTLALDGDRGLVHVDPSAELLTDVEEARTVATMAADAARAAANDARRHGRRRNHRGRRQRRHARGGGPRGRRGRRRRGVVPHRVPVHGSGRHARRGRAGSRLPRSPPRRSTGARCCCEPSMPARTNPSPTSARRRSRTRSSGCEACDWDWHDPTCSCRSCARSFGWRPSSRSA